MQLPRLVLVDVYETLFDMEDVERKVNSLLDSKRGYLIWSELFMQYCFVENCLKGFGDFLKIGAVTMQMAGYQLGKTISEEQAQGILEHLKHVPLHEEVREGLSGIRDMDIRIGALTNASRSIVMERMELTGLISYFEKVLTADEVKMYKPCPEVYEWALKELEELPENCLMVSSHGWDIAGAANAGLQTAFVRNRATSLYPLAPQPAISCRNFTELLQTLEALQVQS